MTAAYWLQEDPLTMVLQQHSVLFAETIKPNVAKINHKQM